MNRRATAALGRLSDAGRPNLARKLDQLLALVAARAADDEEFAAALTEALSDEPGLTSAKRPSLARREGRAPSRPETSKRLRGRNVGGRRPPGPFDPYKAYAEGGEELRRRLETCDVDQLKDIIAEHGMDHDRLALRWKAPERLIERIIETVATRATKGDAFRSPMRPPIGEHVDRMGDR